MTEANNVLETNEELTMPLTFKERSAMNALSMKVYGPKSAWYSLLKKGEFVDHTYMSPSGNSLTVKRSRHLTVNEIKLRMEATLAEREANNKKDESTLEQEPK